MAPPHSSRQALFIRALTLEKETAPTLNIST